jgi:hypothetical protein
VESISVKPGKVGLTTLKEAGDRIDQDAKGRLAQLTTGLAQRSGTFDPAIAVFTVGAMRGLAPDDAKSQTAFCEVIGGCHPMLAQVRDHRGRGREEGGFQ